MYNGVGANTGLGVDASPLHYDCIPCGRFWSAEHSLVLGQVRYRFTRNGRYPFSRWPQSVRKSNMIPISRKAKA